MGYQHSRIICARPERTWGRERKAEERSRMWEGEGGKKARRMAQ